MSDIDEIRQRHERTKRFVTAGGSTANQDRGTLLSEVDTLTAQLAECKSKFNEVDLCQLGEAPCEYAFKLNEQLAERDAQLTELEHWLPIWANALEDERQWSGLARQMRALQPDTQEGE